MIRKVVPVLLLLALLPAQAGLLEDYVRKENKGFAYEIHSESNAYGVRILQVRLTSQVWRGKEWKHWLAVFVPPVVNDHQKGILLIEGGSNRDKAPDPKAGEIATVALSAVNLRAPVAVLLQVPNQPLYDNLYEDDLIAHTFDKYLRGGDDDWPLLLPMVKSATSAMDALQGLAKDGKLKTVGGTAFTMEKFIVGGASKRGWTTWLTAAVDLRVCAMAPSVIDVLNMSEQMEHQRRTYGMFSHMIEPYTSRKVMERFDTPIGEKLRNIVDPYAYLDRLKQPKLMLLGTNDPYWTADAAQLYYPELQGPKALYYLPNAGHGLGLEVLPTLNGFFVSVLEDKPFPQLNFKNGGGMMTVEWDRDATSALWSANSANRDFRKAKWAVSKLSGKRTVKVQFEKPSSGWQGNFVTVTFPGLRAGDLPINLSTPISISPDSYPHE